MVVHLSEIFLHATIAKKGPIRISALRQEPTYTSNGLKQLLKDGAITCEFVAVDQDLFANDKVLPDVPPHLNEQQTQAVDILTKHEGFGGFLLRGITGSGKTEVYLRVIEGPSSEIKARLSSYPRLPLTPQLVQRFRTP